ncbi:MAG: EndoU domain-containing protein [Rhodobiaceae bacterium]|nr:EndoU domain-containing protein [Rhodobiaceae bacterium]
MPTFPVYQRREGLSGGTTASYGSAAPFQARGRALQGLGDAVTGLGSALDQRARRIAEMTEDAWFSRARAETGLQLARQRAEGADPAALITTLDAAQAQRTSEAPSERAAGLFGQWTLHATSALAGDAARFKAGNALDQRGADFNRAREANLEAAKFGDESAWARSQDDLAGFSQWAPPEEVEAQKAESERLFRFARAEHAVASDPQGFLDAIARGNDEALAGLGDDERQGLTEQAQAQLDAQRRDAGAQRVADIARQSRELLARIASGDPAITAHAISNLGLPEQNTQKLQHALEAKQAQNAQVDDVFRRLNEGGVFDPKDTNERLAVSKAYEAAAKGGDLFGEDASARDTTLYLAGSTGVVPEAVLSTLRGAFASDDPARIAAATRLAADLNEASPDALADAGAGTIAGIGTEYTRLTTEMGLSPEQAAGRLMSLLRDAGKAVGSIADLFLPTAANAAMPNAATAGVDQDAGKPDRPAAEDGKYREANAAVTIGRVATRPQSPLWKMLEKVFPGMAATLMPLLNPEAKLEAGDFDEIVNVQGGMAGVRKIGDPTKPIITFVTADGMSAAFQTVMNENGELVPVSGLYFESDGTTTLATKQDMAELWNSYAENAQVESGIGFVAQSQSAGGEGDDEEEQGKPGTGEGEEGAEDPAGDDAETPERKLIRSSDGTYFLSGQNGGPPLEPEPDEEPEGTPPAEEPPKPKGHSSSKVIAELAAHVVTHIFDGEVKINPDTGEKYSTGGHYLHSKFVHFRKLYKNPTQNGIESHYISLPDPDTGELIPKGPPSHFFPRNWTEEEIIRSILEAADNATHFKGNVWIGKSAGGLKINIVVDAAGRIVSAWPMP